MEENYIQAYLDGHFRFRPAKVATVRNAVSRNAVSRGCVSRS
jgi:hypothetical protein